jgi:nitroreductase
MTGPLVAQESFERILGFGKQKTAVGLIPVGVPDEDPPARSRKPLEEIMRMIE